MSFRAELDVAALPELGVGITYCSDLVPLIERHRHLFNFLELEPQTTWVDKSNNGQPYLLVDEILEEIAALPCRKTVHSVGVPVGGTVRPEPAQLALLRRTVAYLKAPWISEHLSFNSTGGHSTGFLLPGRQSSEGVDIAAASIHDFKAAFDVPVAVETGVNYLQRRSDDLADGEFVAAVAEEGDCGILLDLHNIFANAANGRQLVEEFIAQLPLWRIWEVHLAGGMEMDGYWLDAHSGAVPEELMEIAHRIIPRLPNLKAITFEIFPAFVPRFGLDAIRSEITKMHELWKKRGTAAIAQASGRRPLRSDTVSGPAPQEWERALGGLAAGLPVTSPLAAELATDPGVRIISKLVNEFRASMVANCLRLTTRYLMLTLGEDVLRTILQDFWKGCPPHLFGSSEADAFANYLVRLDLQVPQLDKILRFEHAALLTMLDGQPRQLHLASDPFPLFKALAEGHLPTVPSRMGQFDITIAPDNSSLATKTGSYGIPRNVGFS